MRRVIRALASSALLLASGAAGLPVQAAAVAVARQDTSWGVLTDLAGSEWRSERTGSLNRFEWREPNRVLVWSTGQIPEAMRDEVVFTRDEATGAIQGVMPNFFNRRGAVAIDADGGALFSVGGLVSFRIEFGRADSGYVMRGTGLGANTESALTRVGGAAPAVAADAPPRPPGAPIIIATLPEPAPPARSGRNARGSGRAAAPAPAPLAPAAAPPSSPEAGASRSGPIVIASAPPPPGAWRAAPRGAPVAAPRGAAAGSREAQMQAQVETRRVQAAREAEAERQRLAAIAEQARQAEESRRAQEAANSAAWGEAFGLLGAIVGGVAAGASTGGDMTAITAGMAAGSSLAAPSSEISAAANQNFETERARYEAEQAAERELHARTIAAMNDPNNPLTQQQRRAEATRVERAETERADMERRHRDEREAEEREALMAQRETERETARSQAREDQERADQDRAERDRREAEAARQRERDAELRRQEEEERRQAAERERQAREEEQRREAEARRQEQERQRAAAEAERTRVIDFREAVVLCSLTGPQAQFNNWRCEGPLQMTYVNFEQANVAFHFDQMSCASYRELPRAGPYRAFGCGYGLHPTNPGASRNVPEMLGVFVDGRITFRCPRNISGVCRER